MTVGAPPRPTIPPLLLRGPIKWGGAPGTLWSLPYETATYWTSSAESWNVSARPSSQRVEWSAPRGSA